MLSKVRNYFKESKTELSKVSWPGKNELVRLTVVVIAITIAIGAYLGLLDYIFNRILELLITATTGA